MEQNVQRANQPSLSMAGQISQNAEIVIAVMGVTGAGKSSFIATVTGRQDIPVGQDLYSETTEVKAYRFSYGLTNFVLVDTPGFDDSSMTNEEVATKILQWLQASYRNGTRLNGIIYIHNITKPRIQGSAYKNMRLFRQLCGDDALGNVFLATSFWDLVTESVGAKRERELTRSKDFWAGMVAKGSEVVRINPDRAVCLEVLERIAVRNRVDLLVQKELVVQKKKLQDTTVGEALLSSEIQEFEKTVEKEKKAEKKKLKQKLGEGQKAHKEEMRRLRAQQKNDQREEKKRQRSAEKEHKRNVRNDRREMRHERQELEDSIRPTAVYERRCRYLYLAAAVWLVLATSLNADVIAESLDANPASVNYAMFSIVWAWLALLLGVACCSTEGMHPLVPLVGDISAGFFVFCAAVALAAKLGVHSCFDSDYTLNNDVIVGSANSTKRCQELQAIDAFLWFIFISFVFTFGFNASRATKMFSSDGGAMFQV